MHSNELFSVLIFIGIIAIVYVLEISLILRFFINKTSDNQNKKGFVSKVAIYIHILAIFGVVCFLYGYFYEPYWIDVKTINISTDKLKNTSLKIVHISDMHCDKKIRNENKLADIINPLEPDIIVFTGDSLNNIKTLPVFQETLKKLKAKIGKFAVKGNFDVWYWKDLSLFKETGFKVLDKESVKLNKNNENFYISGLSPKFYDYYYNVLKNIPNKDYSIFLYHYSDWIEDLEDVNVDLYLAGHTHGGQVALPFYGALITLSKFGKKYEAGLYKVKNTILYVNRGIGMEGGIAPRVRFCSRPEITVFNIRPENLVKE